MSFEDFITPEQVQATGGSGEVHPRPPGAPTVGLTQARKVVFLQGLTRSQWLQDPVEQVSACGWPRWYPATAADFDAVLAHQEVVTKTRQKTRRKTRGPMFDGDVSDPQEPQKNRHPWN